MPIQRISDLDGEPEVGKSYLVPCIPLYVKSVRGGWWPVLGPSHKDPELGVDDEHYHYDWRFVSAAHLKSVLAEVGGLPYAYAVVARVSGFDHYHGAVEERRMRCKRVMPPFPSHRYSGAPNRLVRILEPKYRGRKLGAWLTCPHRGLSLKNQPVRDGVIVCPGHGLAFDATTGTMVPRLSAGDKS